MELTQGMAAVVTGGASGLGKASAQALADLGLKVTIFDVNEEAGEAHAQVIGGTFVRVLSWYDNEWGFSNRMNDVAVVLGNL